MTHPEVDLGAIGPENTRMTHAGKEKTLPVTTLERIRAATGIQGCPEHGG